MLPVVGIVAAGVLFVAGRLFFLSAPQGNRSELPVISVSPSGSVLPETRPAQAEPVPTSPVREGRVTSDNPAPAAGSAVPQKRVLTTGLDVLAVPYDGKSSSQGSSGGPADKSDAGKQTDNSSQPASGREPPKGRGQAVKVLAPRESQTKKEPTAPTGETPKNPRVAQQSAPKPNTTPEKKEPPKNSWRVQVGAFSTPAAAAAVAQELSRAGYEPIVLHGKLNRVMVQAGSTRAEALAQAAKMGKSGFRGAFIVPPRS
jgi:cell division protein FtsN